MTNQSGFEPTTIISGTAAFGAPIANALVTLKDAAGKSTSTRSASDGRYSLNTTGLTPPFLIQVQTSSGSLYSVSTDALAAGTINTDIYADLTVRSWYAVQGQSIDTAFANPVVLPAPDPSNVQIVSRAISHTALVWLSRAGIDTSLFSLISTPFAADGTGFDAVLHQSSMNLSTGQLTISDGTTTQISTITYDTGTNTVAIRSASSGPRGSSVDYTSTAIPAQQAAETALNSILATVATFTSAINSRGDQLADSDLLPLLAGDALHDGWDRNSYAGVLASSFRGFPGTNSSYQFRLRSIKLLNLSAGQAEVIFNTTLTTNGNLVPFSSDQNFFFERVGGTWLLGGNKRICSIGFGRGFPLTNSYAFAASARCLKDLVASATVTGGGIWNATALPKQIAAVAVVYFPSPGINVQVNMDLFSTPALTPASLVPAGTPFTFRITPASGSPVDYVASNSAETTETIAITSPATTSLSNIALDQPLQVTWTRPTTFPVRATLFSGTASTSPPGGFCRLVPGGIGSILGDVTSTTVNIPSTCNGNSVTGVLLSVSTIGLNGEGASTTLTLN